MRNSEKSCVYIPQVLVDDVDLNGEPYKANRDSLLFHALMKKYPKDRNKQVRLYGIATDPRFREFAEQNFPKYFMNGAGVTEQGEIDLPTLLKLIGEDKVANGSNELVESLLWEEFDATIFDNTTEGFAAGINQVARFNEKNDYRRLYKAQLVSKNGRYEIQLVEWSSMKKEDKTKFIKKSVDEARKEEVKHKILRILADNGVNVQYVEAGMEEALTNTDPSDENISAVEQGYKAYLTISRNSTDTHFYIRAGMFAIYSLGEDDPAVTRIKEILRKDDTIYQAILQQMREKDPIVYNDIINRQGLDKIAAAQELALCYLVGRSLQKQGESVILNIPVVGSFARLITNLVRRAVPFFSIFLNKETQDNIKRNYLSDKIANSLLQGEVGNAVMNLKNVQSRIANTKILPSIRDAAEARLKIKETVKAIKQKKERAGFSEQSFAELDTKLAQFEALKNLKDKNVAQHYATDYKRQVLFELVMLLPFIEDNEEGLVSERMVAEIESTNTFGEALEVAGDKIKVADSMVKMILDIMNVFDFENMTDASVEDIRAVRELKQALDKDIEHIRQATELVSGKFLADVIGADYVAVTLGKKFFGKNQTLEDLGITPSEAKKYKVSGNKYVLPVKVLMNNAKDISWFDKAFVSMGRSKDITFQMIDIYNRRRQDIVRQNTMLRNRKLTQIYKYAAKHSVDMSQFYEYVYDNDKKNYKIPQSDKNGLTGNFIAQSAYSAYDRDVNEYRKRCWEEYKKDRPNVQLEDNAQYQLNERYEWNKFWMEAFEMWNLGFVDGEVHGWRLESDGKVEWVPCTAAQPGPKSIFPIHDYTNYRFVELFGEEGHRSDKQQHNFNVYTELIKMKREIDDECLDYGSTKWYRAPQFKGTMFNQQKNRGNLIGAVDTLMKYQVQRYLDDSDALDFGDDRNHEVGVGDFDPFNTDRYTQRHLMERVSLYGINKLRDMQTLSTDPIQVMKAYSFMAENYKATKDCISALELYHDVVSGKTDKDGKFVMPRKREKLEHYFRSNFYGTGMKPILASNKTLIDSYNQKLQALNTRFGVKVFDKFTLDSTTFVVSQFVTTINRLTTLTFLGGNVGSATLNTLSGIVRLATTGLQGKQYNTFELTAAVGMWMWTKLVDLIWHADLILKRKVADYSTPPTKLELVKEYFNAQNNYENDQRNSHPLTIGEFLQSGLMFTYEIGDDFMNTIAYIAASMHTKVLNENGEEQSVWKSMKVVNASGNVEGKDITRLWKQITTKDPTEGVYMLAMEGPLFRSKTQLETYRYIDKKLQKVEAAILAADGDTDEERLDNVSLDLIKRILEIDPNRPNMYDTSIIHYLASEHALTTTIEKGDDINEIVSAKDVLVKLTEYRDKFTFNEEDISKLRYNINMLNVNMHGVYNTTDKATFQNDIIGCMVSTLKGYAFGYIMREFLGARVDVGGGEKMTFDEFAEKYGLYAEDIDKSSIKQLGSMLFADNAEMTKLFNESEIKDMVNIRILDTDQAEGTLVSCLKMLTSFKGLGLTIAGLGSALANLFPPAGQAVRNHYLKLAETFGYSQEQADNQVREWGMKMVISVLGMLRVLLSATLPPDEETEEEYLNRIIELIDKLNKGEEPLTKREQKLKEVINIKRDPSWSDHDYKQQQIWALTKVEKMREGGPTIQGFLYFCIAASELENRPWMLGNPTYMVAEMRNLLDVMPASIGFLSLVYNATKLRYQSKHGTELMEKAYEQLTSKSMTDFDFVKKHKKPTEEEQLAAHALAAYYEDREDKRKMALPDLTNDDLFQYAFEIRDKKGGTKVVDMKELDAEKKSLVRNAAYKYLDEIWGEEEPVFVKDRTGSYEMADSFVGTVLSPDKTIRHGGAALLARPFSKELSEEIKNNGGKDQLTLSKNKRLISRYYYKTKGYGHEKYEFKYKTLYKKNTPYLKSAIMASEPEGAFDNRLFYYARSR